MAASSVRSERLEPSLAPQREPATGGVEIRCRLVGTGAPRGPADRHWPHFFAR
jgi:hypothetical protein